MAAGCWRLWIGSLFVAVVNGYRWDFSCRYLEMQGEHRDCQGVWKISSPDSLYYRKEITDGGRLWYYPTPGDFLAKVDSNQNTMTCFVGVNTTNVRERNVSFKCAGFSHLSSNDQNDVMDGSNDVHCQYATVTNYETDDDELWGFYKQEHWGGRKKFNRVLDQWGGRPYGGKNARLEVYNDEADQYGVRVRGYNRDGSKRGVFLIPRQRCQGGQKLVYADQEEHDSDVYSYNCFVIKVTGGHCGTGLWSRLFYDDETNEWWYRKWTPKRDSTSDLYYQTSWSRGDRIYWDVTGRRWMCHTPVEVYDEWTQTMEITISHSHVKCIGHSSFEFVDRPWPTKYLDWVRKSPSYTSDEFTECKMYRLLRDYKSFDRGYYIQTSWNAEYLNDEEGVVLRLNKGKWAAKTRCKWNGGTAECRGNYKSHMPAHHNYWTCVSSANYCGYITVTPQDTPAGICQGRWRLYRRNWYGRFDMETKTSNQRIVHRKLNGKYVNIKIVSSNSERLTLMCYEKSINFNVYFEIPRTRCFTHGTYYWNKADYDLPPFNTTAA